MQIKEMFKRNIDRHINGVVSVSDEDGVAQELEEYVVTKELRGHFDTFFTAYEAGLDSPEVNTGVWIQGYFGSGKSHFLKMLSYLLENKQVNGKQTVDYFADKLGDDALMFEKVRRAAQVPTETILFNIDEKGAGYKEGDTSETAVLHAIARVFYEHLGFYGEDYKLARFEKMIDDKGCTAEFRDAYKELTGEDWLATRETYDFYSEEIAQAANQAAGLSVRSITDWANSTENPRTQIDHLVGDIDEYARKREAECGGTFRLVFMIDEMGQYLNGNVGRMLNLQTLMEQFGDRCAGRVWMVVTSQEAIDEMMSVVSTDFSKIQGRFGTRLALSSSSVDEVIKRRVLDKNNSANIVLAHEYEQQKAVLANLFSFANSRGDLRGYASEVDFVDSFPFVGYQFTIMPSVLNEIRKHGYQGKSLSTGERSMLSSYQEATQAVEGGDEKTLVPLWRFFDTLERELDHGVRQVFERCRRDADEGLLKPFDVNVLKVLYLVNYISDIATTADNVAILLVESIDCDMADLKQRTKESLDRLVRENFVGRAGDRYSFLTDEEQDVAREIRDVEVEPSAVIAEVARIVFDGIFTETKHRKGANDFPFDRFVDGALYGKSANGMRLNLITLASDEFKDAPDAFLDMRSQGQALVVLDTASDYYDILYEAERVSRYAQINNVSAMSPSKQDIVKARQREAAAARKEAKDLISQAIVKARVSVDGHSVKIPATTAAQKLDSALDKLVASTFIKADLIEVPLANEVGLQQVLAGRDQLTTDGKPANQGAVDEVKRYLEARGRLHQSTTMGDIQRNFQAKPFGWREIDIAAVVANLWVNQDVALLVGGTRVLSNDRKAADYLTKRGELDRVEVKRRTAMPAVIVSTARANVRELDSSLTVPQDEDGLVSAVANCLSQRKQRYADMVGKRYPSGSRYPGRSDIERAVHLASEVLKQQADPETFLRAFNEASDDLLDNAEDVAKVQNFFDSKQKELFDKAVRTVRLLNQEKVYVEGDTVVTDALAQINAILNMEKPYNRIKDLSGLVKQATDSYDGLVVTKRNELLKQLEGLVREIEQYANSEGSRAKIEVGGIVGDVQREASARRGAIHAATTCSKLDAISAQLTAWQKGCLCRIDNAVARAEDAHAHKQQAIPSHRSTAAKASTPPAPPQPSIKVIPRATALPIEVLHDEAEVDAYVARLKQRLMDALQGSDGVRLG